MKNTKWVLLIMAVGLALRATNFFTISSIEIDGIVYANMATFFSKGAFAAAMKGMRVPFYPMLTSLVYLITGNVEIAGRLVSFISGIALIPLCYYFTKKYIREEAALFAAAAVAIHPYLVVYSTAVLSESLATLLFTGAFFCFYGGMTERKGQLMAASGILLMLAYLTRSEYIIYFFPLAFILLFKERRYVHTAVFLSCFLVLAFAFLLYVRMKTGLWALDMRVLLLQGKSKGLFASTAQFLAIFPPLKAIASIPEIALNFCIALSIPFFLLAAWGFKYTSPKYRLFALVLVVVHILGRSLVIYSTPRYSVEFAPMMIIFTAEGACRFRMYMQNRYQRRGAAATAIVFLLILALSVFMGINNPNRARDLEKKAGLYMRGKTAGSVAARLPISAFYAQTDWFYLGEGRIYLKNCKDISLRLDKSNVGFLAVDDQLEKELPILKGCLNNVKPVVSFSDKEDYINIYTVDAFGNNR